MVRELGLIATAGFNNNWRTRDNLEQTPGSSDLSVLDKDYRTRRHREPRGHQRLARPVLRVRRGNKLRWTNLYVHDTLKRTSLAEGTKQPASGADYCEQNTGWYERELLSTQLTGDLNLDPLTIDARASHSKSKRDAPYELGIGYSAAIRLRSPYGAYFINRLDNGQTGYATLRSRI